MLQLKLEKYVKTTTQESRDFSDSNVEIEAIDKEQEKNQENRIISDPNVANRAKEQLETCDDSSTVKV
jgi:hypothetical protein